MTNLYVAINQKRSIATATLAVTMLLLFALYANLRWLSESPAFEKARETADTPAYVRISGEALFSKDFWANTRPPIFPLLLKLYGTDESKIAAFQAAFSIFAWGILALAMAYSFKGLLRPFAFALVLALSLDRHIAGWDVVLLTESLSVSLMALFLAGWLWLLRGWSWGKVALLSLVALLWGFTRDTNGWILLMVAGLIVLTVLLFQAQKRYLVVAFLFVLIFALTNLSADAGQRWVFPFQNVLAQRILVDSRAVQYFADCGMPITPELLDLAGGFAHSKDRAFYTDPALEPYRLWLHTSGKSCYMRWLFSRPLASMVAPWADFAWLLAFENVTSFYPQYYDPLLPWYVERLLYPQDALLWLWGVATIASLVALWKKPWKGNPAWIAFVVACLLIYLNLFIIWHGDVKGTHRHGLTVSLQFVLSFWLLALLLAEWFLGWLLARVAKQGRA